MPKKITVTALFLAGFLWSGVAFSSDSPPPAETATAADLARSWVKSYIVAAAPPGRPAYYPDSQETADEALARYDDIAKDVVEVVYHPDRKPLFRGRDGRARTVAYVVAIMNHESSFLKHVDYNLGKHGRGDNGKAWCLMQVQPFNGGRTMGWNTALDRPIRSGDPEEDLVQGFTGEEMIANRQSCIVAGLRVLRVSLNACAKSPLQEQLASYASGSCDKGLAASRARVNTAVKWFETSREARKAFTDAGVLSALQLERDRKYFEERGSEPVFVAEGS